MADRSRTIRNAIDQAALTICDVRGGPCYQCRIVARDIVLAFLANAPTPREPIQPFELRLQIAVQVGDG